jgi:hypothetical protein
LVVPTPLEFDNRKLLQLRRGLSMPPLRKEPRLKDKRDAVSDLSKGDREGHRQLRLFAKKGILLNFPVECLARLT